jgi:hypothetical protein
MKAIDLGGGHYTVVSDEDAEYLNRWKWCRSAFGYAVRNKQKGEYTDSQRGMVWMHRVVLGRIGLDPDLRVDHSRHNTLDNRRESLRAATNQQNNWNQRKANGCTSRFKHVYWNSQTGKWRLEIRGSDGKRVAEKDFDNEEDAAHAADRVIVATRGDFACVNFPEEFEDRYSSVHEDDSPPLPSLDLIELLPKPERNPLPYRGEKNGAAKLKSSDKPLIFAMRQQGLTQSKIAGVLGVTQSLVSQVLLGKIWTHVFPELNEQASQVA